MTAKKRKKPALPCLRSFPAGPCDLDVENPLGLCRNCYALWYRTDQSKKGER